MTRLEQRDSYRTEFEAWLEGVEVGPDGTWWRLDASAFYPTGGGQPHDTGEMLAHDGRRFAVDDVTLRDGVVWHRVRPVDDPERGGDIAVGAAVRGRVDWQRRFRHMQRHSAQHLLSQAFVRIDESYATRSVGLTSPDATVDLAGEPDDAAVRAAEALVNEVATQALPIRAFEIDEQEVERYPLRRPPKVRGRIRVVEIGSWERSACGGTHLRSTAEALPVLVQGTERIRGDLLRVTFRAGLEAVEHAAVTQRAARAAAARLSSGVADLDARVAALQEEAASARRLAAGLRTELADALADALAPEAAGAVVVHRLPPERSGLETELADALARRGATAAVAAPHGTDVRLVLASGAGVDVRPALEAALAELGGRGGGRPERAQGAGPGVARLDAALAAARSLLETATAAKRG